MLPADSVMANEFADSQEIKRTTSQINEKCLHSSHFLDLIWWANDNLIWTTKSLSGKWNHACSTKIWSELNYVEINNNPAWKQTLLFGLMLLFPTARGFSESRNKQKKNTSR